MTALREAVRSRRHRRRRHVQDRPRRSSRSTRTATPARRSSRSTRSTLPAPVARATGSSRPRSTTSSHRLAGAGGHSDPRLLSIRPGTGHWPPLSRALNVTSLASPASPSRPISRGATVRRHRDRRGRGRTRSCCGGPPARQRADVDAGPVRRHPAVVNALTIGAIYALIALGYTMVYGIIELINFAHGDVFMVGAFASMSSSSAGSGSERGRRQRSPSLIVLLARRLHRHDAAHRPPGVAIERLVYRPLRNAPRLAPLITAIGVSFILQNAALVIAGSGDRSAPPGLSRCSGRSRSAAPRSRSSRSSSSPSRSR